MSHTNSTTNYSLPQFVTTDKPAWLTDVNNAYLAIDTGMNNAQTKANTADSNATQALSDASDAAAAASAADAKGAGAVASIADTFQATETYAVGDLVMYNNLLYICTVAVTTPGAWTGSTNWSRSTVESNIPQTAGDITYNSGTTYASGSVGDAISDIPVFNTYHLNVGAISINTHYSGGDMYYADVDIPDAIKPDIAELLAVTMTDYGGLSNTLQFQIRTGLVIRIWSKTAQTLSTLWLKVLYRKS